MMNNRNITGRRLLGALLSWDFPWYRQPHTPQSRSRRGWSARLRGRLKQALRSRLREAEQEET